MNSFVSTFDGQEFDATLFRYIGEDDFGRPKTAFVICVFWYIDALATLDRFPEAREFFEKVLAYRNALGLLSEDVDPHSGELWGGNLGDRQSRSHVRLNPPSAIMISPVRYSDATSIAAISAISSGRAALRIGARSRQRF